MGAGGHGLLAGKVAFVTGAARGIGRASCIALAREGAAVFGADIAGPVSTTLEVVPATPDDLAETGRLVNAAGGRWSSAQFDQRDIRAVREAAGRAAAEFGGIDLVFANASIQAFKPILNMEDADWQDTIDVNLTGNMNVLRSLAPYLVQRGGGSIVITSSTQGQHGTKFGSAYSASKWGLIGLMKSAAMELGAHKIRVNCVIPGLVDTELTRHRERYAQAVGDLDSPRSTAELERATREQFAGKSPLGVGFIDPDDIAPTVVFLAGDASRMITGASIDVTAGLSVSNVA